MNPVLATRRATAAALPLVGLLLIVALDRAADRPNHSTAVVGLLDEPAHLTTALLALAAVLPRGELWRRPALCVAAAFGSMAIDIDHIPVYLGLTQVAVPHGRPYSHSLATAALLGLAALGSRGRSRELLGGLSAGVLLHFVRDIGTGPGIPWAFPFSRTPYLAHYTFYLGSVAALALVASIRALQGDTFLDRPAGAVSEGQVDGALTSRGCGSSSRSGPDRSRTAAGRAPGPDAAGRGPRRS